MLKKRLVGLTLVAMAVLVLSACGPLPTPDVGRETTIIEETTVPEEAVTAGVEVAASASPVPEPTETTSAQEPEAELEGLWFPITGDPGSLDIQVGDIMVVGQCIEGLFEYRGDGSIEPAGATGFDVSDDGLAYTIHLRPEAVWSDGEPVTAQHYVDGVIRLLRPETEAEYAWGMYDVEGAEAFNTGKTGDPATVGVRAVDKSTLEIRLAKPAAHFETLLPMSSFWPVRLDVIEEHGDRWTEPGNYLSNGPYLLEAWEHGEVVVLVKNPSYWNAGQVEIETITLPVIKDPGSTLTMYKEGKLHSTGGLSSAVDVRSILADPTLSQAVKVEPHPGLYYLGLNTLRPPTDDPLVRRALVLAFDREAFLEAHVAWPDLSPQTCTIPPKIMGHQPQGTCGHSYDPELARALLAEAGYPNGEGFPTLEVWSNRTDYREKTTQALATAWEENLGVSTEIHLVDWGTYLDYLDECISSKEALAACKLHAYIQAWEMDYGDPQALLELVFAPYSAYQYTGWENDRYEELLALAATEYDTARRAEYYKEADTILCQDDVAIVPVHSWQWRALVREGVTFEYPPFGEPRFKHWALP